MHPNKTKLNRLDKNIKEAGGVAEKRQESIDTANHRLVTDKQRTILADETHSLRPAHTHTHTETQTTDT